MSQRKRRTFTPEFKADTVRLVLDEGMSVAQVARDLDLHDSSLRNWLRQAKVDRAVTNSGALTTDERAELQRLKRKLRQVEMERDILKKGDGLLRAREQLRFAFIEAEKACWPIAVMSRVLKVSRAGFYAWRTRGRSKKQQRDDELLALIRESYQRSDATYGSPRVFDDLIVLGERVSRKRVERLMREDGLTAAPPRRRYRCAVVEGALGVIAPDLVVRDFGAQRPNEIWVTDIERHEALTNPAVMKGAPPSARRSVLGEAEDSLNSGTGARVGAVPTTTERASTARCPGSGKQDGKAYVRNQRQNAPQVKTTSSNLADSGWVAAQSRATRVARGTLWPVDVAGKEATMQDCGVVVAKLQGHSWAPPPSKGLRVNVGTISEAPSPIRVLQIGGKARRHPMLPGWGREPVVVRGRESRPHGEGVQRSRSIAAARGGR